MSATAGPNRVLCQHECVLCYLSHGNKRNWPLESGDVMEYLLLEAWLSISLSQSTTLAQLAYTGSLPGSLSRFF